VVTFVIVAPPIRYVRNDHFNIAYQVVGDATVDLVGGARSRGSRDQQLRATAERRRTRASAVFVPRGGSEGLYYRDNVDDVMDDRRR
jgi:hypothetical protein